MVDYRAIERTLTESFQLAHRPVAVAFPKTPPPQVAKFNRQAPSGCTFWSLAAGGETFYTVAADHYNCPIGAYTHNIALPAQRASELNDTLGLMVNIGYLRMEEVPGIPRLSEPPEVIVYAPLGDTPLDPDVVVCWDRPSRIMLLQEAAIRAGVPSKAPALARPTCMALPAALSAGTVTSTGCIGNRIYTDLGDDELYVTIAGEAVGRIADQAASIAGANAQLKSYHQDRRQALTTA